MILFYNIDGTITDAENDKVYSIDEAKKLYEEGKVKDMNVALYRLKYFNWDKEALEKYFKEQD